MMQGTEGRDTDGAGSAGIVEEKGQAGTPRARSPDGEGTDGAGSGGMVREQTRMAEAGETGQTRFGAEGDDTDGPGSGGILDEKPADDDASEEQVP